MSRYCAMPWRTFSLSRSDRVWIRDSLQQNSTLTVGPGPHQEHALTISVRDTSLAVTADGIPHEWISTGTGYIDSRFSRQIAALLSDLETKAQREGRFI